MVLFTSMPPLPMEKSCTPSSGPSHELTARWQVAPAPTIARRTSSSPNRPTSASGPRTPSEPRSMNSCQARMRARNAWKIIASLSAAEALSIPATSSAITPNSSRLPDVCRHSPIQVCPAASWPSSASITVKPPPAGSCSARGSLISRKPISSASSLPGKCRPARSWNGPPAATLMVFQPWPSVGAESRARQAAAISPRSVSGSIFLLPKHVVDLVLHQLFGFALGEADGKSDDRGRSFGELDTRLLRIKSVDDQQTTFRCGFHIWCALATYVPDRWAVGDLRLRLVLKARRIMLLGSAGELERSLPGLDVESDRLV